MKKKPDAPDTSVSVIAVSNEFTTPAPDAERQMPSEISIPFGTYPYRKMAHPKTKREYFVTQIFGREGAAYIANEVASAVKRGKGIPIYQGHPDDPDLAPKYPDKSALGWITEAVTLANEMKVSVRWLRNPGEGFSHYSPYWGGPIVVTDEVKGQARLDVRRLQSLALTNTPHNKDFLLPNEGQDGGDENADEPTTKDNIMDIKQLAAILGLAETATAEEVIAALQKVMGDLKAAQGAAAQVTAANEAATTAKKSLIAHIVTAAVTDGRITGADRAVWEGRLANEATFAAESAAIAALKPTLKTTATATQKHVDPQTGLTEGETLMKLANEAQLANPGWDFDKAWAHVRRTRPELFGQAKG